MAINKNFVIKNGVQVSTDLIIGDSDNNKVGIGTTIPGYDLHVAIGRKSRGGIGATDLVVTGVSTVKDLLVTGFSGFSSDVSVTGIVSARSFGIGTTEVIDRGLRLSGIASLDAITINTIEQAIRVGPNSFTDLKVTGISTFIGIATFSTGIDIKSGVSTFSAPLRLGFAHTTDHAGVALGATVGFGTSAFFRDDAAIFMGSDSDLKIHHDGSNSRIQDVGTGDLIIQGSADIKLQSASEENYIVANDTGSVDVYFDNSKKLETTSGGLKVTGITTLTDRLHVEAGISTFDADVRFGIGATVGFGTSAFFKDNAAIYIGDDSDLRIYSDGSTSFLKSNDLRLQSLTGESYITNTANGAVVLFYDDSSKLATTSGGLNITGITTFSDRINVVSGVSTFQDDAKLTFGAQTDLLIQHDGTDTEIYNKTGNLKIRSDDLDIQDYTNGHSMITADKDGSVDLYYDNYNALQTTPQGVNVSGVTTSNRLNISGVSTFTSIGSNLIPDTDGSRNIGAAGSEWQDLFIDGTAKIDALEADTAKIGDLTNNRVVIVGTSGELEDSGNLTFNGSFLTVTGDQSVSGTFSVGAGASIHATTGNAAFAGIVTTGGALIVGAGATISGDILPDADGSRDLGSSTLEFQDLFIDGTANIDALVADTAKVSDLTQHGIVLAGAAGELVTDGNIDFNTSTNILDVVGEIKVDNTAGNGNIKVGSAATISANGNAAFAGVVTANGGINVGTAVTIHPHGGVSIAGIVTIGSDLNVQGDIVYDEITGRNLNITGISTQAGQVNFGTSGVGATIAVNGNATFAGIVTAAQFQGGRVGVGIGSTTDNPFSGEKVGYRFTLIKFAGPGV